MGRGREKPHGAVRRRTELLRTALAATRAVRRRNVLTAPLRYRTACTPPRLVCLAPLSGAPAARSRSGTGRTVWHIIHFYMYRINRCGTAQMPRRSRTTLCGLAFSHCATEAVRHRPAGNSQPEVIIEESE